LAGGMGRRLLHLLPPPVLVTVALLAAGCAPRDGASGETSANEEDQPTTVISTANDTCTFVAKVVAQSTPADAYSPETFTEFAGLTVFVHLDHRDNGAPTDLFTRQAVFNVPCDVDTTVSVATQAGTGDWPWVDLPINGDTAVNTNDAWEHRIVLQGCSDDGVLVDGSACRERNGMIELCTPFDGWVDITWDPTILCDNGTAVSG